jgi:hypothetical protein
MAFIRIQMYQNANRPMKKMLRPRPNYKNEFHLIINGKKLNILEHMVMMNSFLVLFQQVL